MPLNRSDQALYSALGRAVAARRSALPGVVSQEELALRTGGALSRSAIANIETGRHRVAVHQLVTLARALGCEPSDLLPKQQDLAQYEPSDPAATELLRSLSSPRTRSIFDRED